MIPPRKKASKKSVSIQKRSIAKEEVDLEKEAEKKAKIISKKKILFTFGP